MMEICRTKKILSVMLASWILVSMFYYNIFSLVRSYSFPMKDDMYKSTIYHNIGNEDFLINVPGCAIPNYAKTLKFEEVKNTHNTCGARAIFVNKLSDQHIQFYIDKSKLNKYLHRKRNVTCCYRFASRSSVPKKEDTAISYSPCVSFENGTKAIIKEEVITVSCTTHSGNKIETVYEDSYIILKKIEEHDGMKDGNNTWNVLIIGMDTMSRARMMSTMPRTVKYFQQHHWLDYKGYHKIGENTFPNVVALLSGKKVSSMYTECSKGMHICNKYMMWSYFKEADYVTAYGEDYLRLPDTFSRYNGFKTLPTDHYMRPFYLTGEKPNGNLICAGKTASALNILNYAYDFAKVYEKNKFFGMFWLNSFSHNLNNIPALLDNDMKAFFERLHESNVMDNTFIIFISDHGIRFGPMRVPVESYYEERLPMLFIWTPYKFRNVSYQQYYNMQLNQYRLITPYDLHFTLWDILKMSNTSVDVVKSEACPECSSLFEEKSPQRTCSDAGVDKKWCSCHNMEEADPNDAKATQSLKLAVSYIQSKRDHIKTTPCTRCELLKLKTVLRNHSYNEGNKSYYVAAFTMLPGDVSYEATVEVDSDGLELIHPTQTISAYNVHGNCVVKPLDRPYCVCAKQKCNKG